MPSYRVKKKCFLCGTVEDVTLFKFPTGIEKKGAWARFCGLEVENIKRACYLCLRHFSTDSVIGGLSRIRLKKKAIPTRNPEKKIQIDIGELMKKDISQNKCCLCLSNTNKESPLFRFPLIAETRTAWLEFCNLEEGDYLKNYRLCSIHFRPDCVKSDINTLKRTLKRNSIPSIRACTSSEDPSIISDDIVDENHPASQIMEPTEPASFEDLSIISDDIVDENHPASQIMVPIEPIIDIIEENHSLVVQKDSASVLQLLHPTDIYLPTTSKTFPIESMLASSLSSQEMNYEIPETQHHEEISNVQITPSTTSVTKKYSPRYIGDVKTPHLETPKSAKKYFTMAKAELQKSREKIKRLQVENLRLRQKVKTYQDMITHLKESNLLTEKT